VFDAAAPEERLFTFGSMASGDQSSANRFHQDSEPSIPDELLHNNLELYGIHDTSFELQSVLFEGSSL
jgi:hypothetical protein